MTQIDQNMQSILDKKNRELKDKDILLKELLKQIEIEKNLIQDSILINIKETVLPVIDKLKQEATDNQTKYLNLLIKHLEQLTSPFIREVKNNIHVLTPREIQICNLIKNGMTNKEIAHLQNVSPLTVHTHRNRIRKKLGLAHKKINLSNYLRTL